MKIADSKTSQGIRTKWKVILCCWKCAMQGCWVHGPLERDVKNIWRCNCSVKAFEHYVIGVSEAAGSTLFLHWKKKGSQSCSKVAIKSGFLLNLHCFKPKNRDERQTCRRAELGWGDRASLWLGGSSSHCLRGSQNGCLSRWAGCTPLAFYSELHSHMTESQFKKQL